MLPKKALSLCAIVIGLSVTANVHAAAPGFRMISSENGVQLWRKGKEYVQVISPSKGARVSLLHGDMIPSDAPGTHFARKDMTSWWNEWRKQEPGAFSMVNGEFFNTDNRDKSPIAFSVKIGGMVYPGYGDATEYQGKKMMLLLGNKVASMEKYDDDAGMLYAREETDAIVGLKPDAAKQPGKRLGRTFVGVTKTGDVVIFTSPAALQRYATRMMLAFGAKRDGVMMLDGGASTQLIIGNDLKIPLNHNDKDAWARAVPQAIGVTAGGKDVANR